MKILISLLLVLAGPALFVVITTLLCLVAAMGRLCPIARSAMLFRPLLCGVFVAENLSVIAQVAYFKKGKRRGVKQRLFRRAPLHHHYNMEEEKLDPECTYLFKGPQRPLHEAKITVRFWIVTIVMAAITLMTLKIR